MSHRASRRAAIVALVTAAALSLPTVALAAGNPGNGGGGGGRPPRGGSSSVGNNLSNPAVFAEGIGILGTPSDGTTGYTATWTGLRVPAAGNPTLPAPGTEAFNLATWTDGSTVYYLQGRAENTWQASWTDGSAASPTHAMVKWGDNLQGVTWSSTATIHVEVSMRDVAAAPAGSTYFPTRSLYGTGSTETFGTSATAAVPADSSVVHSVYSEAAYLRIEPIDQQYGVVTGAPVHVLATWNRAVEGPSTSALTPEVNASGSIVYSYNWFGTRDRLAAGWYRLTFGVLESGTLPGIATVPQRYANVQVDGVLAGGEGETPKYVPKADPGLDVSTLDIYLASGRTGGSGNGGGGGGHGGGGR